MDEGKGGDVTPEGSGGFRHASSGPRLDEFVGESDVHYFQVMKKFMQEQRLADIFGRPGEVSSADVQNLRGEGFVIGDGPRLFIVIGMSESS